MSRTATQIPASEERDPFLKGLNERVPADVRATFTQEQLDALRVAFGARQWGRHSLDLRGTFSLWRSRYYFVILFGRNRRDLSRLERRLSLLGKAAAVTAFLVFCMAVGLVGLYLIKSALGINLFPNFSLGLWDWFRQA
ncbi:3-phosphoshikimate 1-carboxyvinyltransferase [Pseudomonas sp. Marseille-QA0892]